MCENSPLFYFCTLNQFAKINIREKLTTAALDSTCEGSTMESEPLWLVVVTILYLLVSDLYPMKSSSEQQFNVDIFHPSPLKFVFVTTWNSFSILIIYARNFFARLIFIVYCHAQKYPDLRYLLKLCTFLSESIIRDTTTLFC